MFDYRIEAGNPVKLGVTKNGKDINFAVVVRERSLGNSYQRAP